ncbi:MAG TPA: peptidylprolyl isomerase, partial [Micavibrio sp.]
DGIQLSTLRDQIRSQIAWGKVVQKKLRPQVEVTDNDVDEREHFLQTSLGKTQYRVAEIFLPVDSQQQDADVQGLAKRLTTEILQNKAPFPQVAAQFSQGAGAAKGGDLGWIQEGQLPDPLNAALASMNDGDMTQPLRSPAGYHILLLRGKRTVQAENLPARDQIMNQIGTERLDRLQRRYLMDLKSGAFVERRV